MCLTKLKIDFGFYPVGHRTVQELSGGELCTGELSSGISLSGELSSGVSFSGSCVLRMSWGVLIGTL